MVKNCLANSSNRKPASDSSSLIDNNNLGASIRKIIGSAKTSQA
jgi:hypothetical protein